MKELLQLLTVDGATPELIERATYYGRIILPGQVFIFVGSILDWNLETLFDVFVFTLRHLYFSSSGSTTS